ncbi:acyl carrier protein [Paraphotobacterium marinum]|uniref:Acyl carrier protein n=1 Tax=Paraphotobacterium marinum TaxID=1755811 RepID=A0A220VHK5_9GAMM|nr:acyl carrier protein [Paraphotobacterium marinum]ASK79662.1 acyl carrier protein [Paraphotobacterium marinum]
MIEQNDDIYIKIKSILFKLFEIEENEINLDSHLYNDLDLDSIDTVDLIVYLQNMTSQKVDPEDFKNVRTVKDVVNQAKKLLQK